MKSIGKFFLNILILAWMVIAIFVTVCLLSYNEFGVSSFGKYTLLIMDSDEMEPEILEGDLIIIKRNSDNKINVGEKVFYYNSAKDSKTLVYNGVIEDKKDIDRDETTYYINNQKVSSEYVIGKIDSSKIYHKVGTWLNIFCSKWGYMFLVIFPTLFAIIYEIILIIDTSKSNKHSKIEE